MTRPNMRASNQFNSTSKFTDHSGTSLGESGRYKSVSKEWKAINNEIGAHQNQGIDVELIRRAKIAHGLQRDHHRSERTGGKMRGIVKGKIT